jgi:hypothetical protein
LKEKRNIDIVKDSAFHERNEIFKAVSIDLKRKGLGGTNHHPPISQKDLQKLYSGDTPVFDTNTPYGIQRNYSVPLQKRKRKFEINYNKHIQDCKR